MLLLTTVCRARTLTEFSSMPMSLSTPRMLHWSFLIMVTEQELVVRILSFTTASTSSRFFSCCTSTCCLSTFLKRGRSGPSPGLPETSLVEDEEKNFTCLWNPWAASSLPILVSSVFQKMIGAWSCPVPPGWRWPSQPLCPAAQKACPRMSRCKSGSLSRTLLVGHVRSKSR